MLRLIRFSKFSLNLKENYGKLIKRSFLSPAYNCDEAWEKRLNHQLLKKVNLEELYYEIDQRYSKSKLISFIDVDIFVNAIKDETYNEEMLDLVHKLRLTPETSSSLPSMSYSVVRTLLRNKKIEELHTILDDRINYGVFLNTHSINLLLDYFWNEKDYVSGARIASHVMLQEDDYHPITNSLSLLHCYHFLLNKSEWKFPPLPEEPKEEVKIRISYLRNPYDDEHFDLRDSTKIIGKTLIYLTKNNKDPVSISFNILGNVLFGKIDKAKEIIEQSNKETLVKEIIDLIPEDSELKDLVSNLKLNSIDLNKILVNEVEKGIQKSSETDINEQCELFKHWEDERMRCLLEKEKLLLKQLSIEKLEKIQEELKEKETKLWFFENEEKIDLEIEEKEELKANEIKPTYKIKKVVNDDDYIPPSIRK